ncbi:MAG: hypothetical protein FJ381_12345 [Verrucomicrobia bacterium]|nr:hypothetical protein [Verrucomicrobiota bacterium]
MKNRSNVSLSLRKLFTAMLAVGPVAILPSPVWAALPTSADFAVQNGSASVATVGSVATISSSDRAVLQWGAGKFLIAAGETYNFQMPAGGAVLNRVGTTAAVDTATIAGNIDSNGRVFILAPGGTINVHSGASVTASGGLVLSTLNEDNGSFLTSGNLVSLPGAIAASNGAISIGIPNPAAPGAAAPIFTSSVSAASGSLSLASVNASGDVTVRSVNAATPLSLAANGNVLVRGNLAATATNSDITQATGAGTGTITVGDTTNMLRLATFTTTGSNNITLDNVGNDFSNISLNTAVGSAAAGAVVVKDVSDIYLANSTLGGSLAVTAAGFATFPAIATVGTIAVAGNADFSTTGANTRTGVSISQNSTVGGTLSGTVSNNSSFSFTGLGNVKIGTISALVTSGGVTINTTGNIVSDVGTTVAASGNSATNGGAINLIGTAINTSAGTLTAGTAAAAGTVSLNATAGNVTIGAINSNRTVTLTAAAGNISQAAGKIITTTTASARPPARSSPPPPKG